MPFLGRSCCCLFVHYKIVTNKHRNQQTSGACHRADSGRRLAAELSRRQACGQVCECVDTWEQGHLMQPASGGMPRRIWLSYTAYQSMAPLSLLGTVVRDKMMKTVTVQVALPPPKAPLIFPFHLLDHVSARRSSVRATCVTSSRTCSSICSIVFDGPQL